MISINANSLEAQNANGSAGEQLSLVRSESECALAWLALAHIILVLLVSIFWIAPLLVKETDLQQAQSFFMDAFKHECSPEPLEHVRWLCLLFIAPALWTVSLFFQNRVAESLRHREGTYRAALGVAHLTQLVFTSFLLLNLANDRSRLTDFWFPGLIACLISLLGCIRYTRLLTRNPIPSNQKTTRYQFFSVIIPIVIALVYTLLRVLPGLVKDVSQWSPAAESHFEFSFGEFCAILNGKTILVDFFPQYQNLSVYLLAPLFGLVGMTPFSFTLAMVTLSVFVLGMAGRILHHLTQNWWATLLLYLPVCTAASFPMMVQEPTFNTANYFVAMPLRYFGPFLVASLVLHYLCKPSSLRQVVLFFVAALAAINNLDFGVPALGAALATVVVSSTKRFVPEWKELSKTAGLFSLALTLALGCFALITFVRSHQLPDLSRIADIQRMWVMGGFGMVPAPNLGIHWNVYSTFMTGLLWSLRSYSKDFRSPQQASMNGLLLFFSIFGCGAMTYFVGRSHVPQLTVVFPAWTFTLALLATTLWQSFAYKLSTEDHPFRSSLRAGLIPLAVLLAPIFLFIGNGATASPSPVAEIKRLFYDRHDDLGLLPVKQFIEVRIRPGERVAIMHPYGFQLANSLGIRNYIAFTINVQAKKQLESALKNLETNQVKHVFMENARLNGAKHLDEWREALRASGYRMNDEVHCNLPPYSYVEHWSK